MIIILSWNCCCGCAAAAEKPVTLNGDAPFVLSPEAQEQKQDLIQQITDCKERMKYATMLKTAAYGLGYNNSHSIIVTAAQEWNNANQKCNELQNDLNAIVAEEKAWDARLAEYPAATTIWIYLKLLGYNDYVCAGILGNMMAECGGGTLNLKTNLVSADGGYYGICQWSRGYGSAVWNKDLDGQLNHLRDTIQKEFKTFGNLYQRGFTFDKFLSLSDCRSAAVAFAKVYERCASKHINIRADYAEKAFKYYAAS